MKRLLLLPLMFALWACVGFATSAVPDAGSPFDGFGPAASASVGVVSVPIDPTSRKLGASYPAIPIPASQAEGDLLVYHSGVWNGFVPGTAGNVLTSAGPGSLPTWAASGAASSITGTGLWHSTAGTLDPAAFIGTSGQIPITNAGATNTPWVSLSGDCTLVASGAVTCAKINGTSVPVGGSLTTGNSPYVSGASAVTWSALNLAGGSGWVTGVLPATNQANQVVSGDVSGNTGGTTVIGIRGTTVPSVSGTGTTVLTDTSGVLSWTAPSAASVTGSGLWHSTSGTLDSAASHGTAAQFYVTNSGATDDAWVTMSGDCTLASTGAVTCSKVNGASYGAAGALTTGNAPYVSGASATTYSALNLAGGSGWITGVLPSANQASQTMGGDVTGTTAASVVAALQGFSVATTTPTSAQVLTWNSGTSKWTPTAASGGTSVTGTGLWYSASGTLNGAAIGLNGDGSIGALSGGNVPLTITKVNSTSYPAGGSLTTGNSPYVSGSSAVTYQALNLAGGAGWVTGVLPAANLPSLAGDVTGAVNSTTVAAITGSSPIAVTPNALRWVQGATAPQFSQQAQANGSAPVNWKWSPQAPGAGASTTANGTPGSAIVDLSAPVSTGNEAQLQVTRAGTGYAAMGPVSSTASALWLYAGASAPSSANYAIQQNSGSVTTLNTAAIIQFMGTSGNIWGELASSGGNRGWVFGFPGTSTFDGGDSVVSLVDALTVPTSAASGHTLIYSNTHVLETNGTGFQFNKTVTPTITIVGQTTDTATHDLTIKGNDAFSSAVTNTAGGNVVIKGGARAGAGVEGSAKLVTADANAQVLAQDGQVQLFTSGGPLLLSLPLVNFDKSQTTPTITQASQTTDVAPPALDFKAGDAWTSATTNIVGAIARLRGGAGASGGIAGPATMMTNNNAVHIDVQASPALALAVNGTATADVAPRGVGTVNSQVTVSHKYRLFCRTTTATLVGCGGFFTTIANGKMGTYVAHWQARDVTTVGGANDAFGEFTFAYQENTAGALIVVGAGAGVPADVIKVLGGGTPPSGANFTTTSSGDTVRINVGGFVGTDTVDWSLDVDEMFN